MSGFRVLSIRAERSNEAKPSKEDLERGRVIDGGVLSGTLLQLSMVHNEAAWRVVRKLKDLVAHSPHARRIGHRNMRDKVS